MKRELIFSAFLLGCVKTAPQPSPPPLEVSVDDAGASNEEEAFDAASPCAKACANLVKLGCAEGQPTVSGSACYTVCRNAAPLLKVSCVVDSKSLAEVQRCGVRCLK